MKRLFSIITFIGIVSLCANGANPERIGIIGLDTSHSIAFTKLLNDQSSKDDLVVRYEVVAAYPYGTRNIESATSRIPKYTEEIQQYGVKITSSIAELCTATQN